MLITISFRKAGLLLIHCSWTAGNKLHVDQFGQNQTFAQNVQFDIFWFYLVLNYFGQSAYCLKIKANTSLSFGTRFTKRSKR